MVQASDVWWGSYQAYEGPWYKGNTEYEASDNPTFSEKLLLTITATEGGHLNAWNGYDVCIATGGVIQWCNRAPQRSVDKMMGKFIEKNKGLLDEYMKQIDPSVEYKLEGNDCFLYYQGRKIDTVEEQKQFFLGGSSGLRGQWTQAQKSWAKNIASVYASALGDPEFHSAQLEFTSPKLLSFATAFGAKELFEGNYPTDGWDGAFRAIYISYAANMPAYIVRKYKQLKAELESLSPENRCIRFAKACAFEVGVAIYPRRYDMIRKTVENLFDVNLPDFSGELAKWKATFPEGCFIIDEPVEIQQELIDQGYDLGPWGADGRFGNKTTEAIKSFQRTANLKDDGIVGPLTIKALNEARHERIGLVCT